MLYEREILEALQKAVLAAAGTIPVKYVGRNFTPPNDGKWWEVIYVPNSLDDSAIGSSQTYQGILRLILHWPQDNSGAYSMLDEVRRMASFFEKGSVFGTVVNVRITNHPNLLSLIEQPPEMLAGISIRYNCFIP